MFAQTFEQAREAGRYSTLRKEMQSELYSPMYAILPWLWYTNGALDWDLLPVKSFSVFARYLPCCSATYSKHLWMSHRKLKQLLVWRTLVRWGIISHMTVNCESTLCSARSMRQWNRDSTSCSHYRRQHLHRVPFYKLCIPHRTCLIEL